MIIKRAVGSIMTYADVAIVLVMMVSSTRCKSNNKFSQPNGGSPGDANVPSALVAALPPLIPRTAPLVAATYYFQPAAVRQSDNLDSSVNTNSVINGDEAEETCTAADRRKGTCYDATSCMNRGGTPIGKCGDQNNVCCVFELVCGDSATERYTYFRNPGFPLPYDKPGMCRVKIGKLDSSICQFRLDFMTFDIAQPIDGNCSQDVFVVAGQNENYHVPRICGFNEGHHMYVGVDESGIVTLHTMMIGNYDRKFDIRITQLKCNTNQIAPAHCLQYYTGSTGIIRSFNYEFEDESGFTMDTQGYPNDLDYTICLKKELGFCTISYEISTDSSGNPLPFAVGSKVGTATSTHGHLHNECMDDYLVIGGMRLCSGRMPGDGHSALTTIDHEGNYTQGSALFTDSTPGPFLIRFVSNGVNNAHGFSLNYRQNPCK